MPNFLANNNLAEAGYWGEQLGRTLGQGLAQIPQQRMQQQMQQQQMKQRQDYQQGLMGLRQQEVTNQQTWHDQENSLHQQLLLEQKQRDTDSRTHQQLMEQIAVQNQQIAQMNQMLNIAQARQGKFEGGNFVPGIQFGQQGFGQQGLGQQASQPQQPQQPQPWQPTPDIGEQSRFWNPEANTWNQPGTTSQLSREGRGIPMNNQPQQQGLPAAMPSGPVPGPNAGMQPNGLPAGYIPKNVISPPAAGRNTGIETGGQFDANRAKYLGDYLSILASTNNLAQRIKQQDPNLIPHLSNWIYNTQLLGPQSIPTNASPAVPTWQQWDAAN